MKRIVPNLFVVVGMAGSLVACGGSHAPPPTSTTSLSSAEIRPTPIRGVLRLENGVLVLQDCSGITPMTVVAGGEYEGLLRSYNDVARYPGDTVLVGVIGRVGAVQNGTGDGWASQVVVDRIASVAPNMSCQGVPSAMSHR